MSEKSVAPVDPAREPLDLTFEQMRAGVYATWYPAIPIWDEDGQAHIDRATRRLVDHARRTPR